MPFQSLDLLSYFNSDFGSNCNAPTLFISHAKLMVRKAQVLPFQTSESFGSREDWDGLLQEKIKDLLMDKQNRKLLLLTFPSVQLL